MGRLLAEGYSPIAKTGEISESIDEQTSSKTTRYQSHLTMRIGSSRLNGMASECLLTARIRFVNLKSKNNHSFNRKFPVIKTELEGLGLNAVLDGELVVLNEKGSADFNKIMSAINTGTLVYYVFDIIWYDGYNLMNAPLTDRRKVLKSILPTSNIIRFSDHVDRRGKDLFKLAQQHRIEGIVGKNKQSVYTPVKRRKPG